jgi:hypothetical protein
VRQLHPDRHTNFIELFVDSDRHKELIDVCIKTPRKNKDGKDMKKTKRIVSSYRRQQGILMGRILTLLKPRKITYSIIQLSHILCSLRFIHKDFVEEQHKTKMKQNGKFERLTKEEKDKIKKDKKEEQKEKAKQNEWRIKDKPKQSKKRQKKPIQNSNT